MGEIIKCGKDAKAPGDSVLPCTRKVGHRGKCEWWDHNDGHKRRYYPPTESDIPMHGWRPYSEIHRERVRAHKKHDAGGNSMERRDWDEPQWLPVVMEEVGEVARALCEADIQGWDREKIKDELKGELVQVGAMVCAWIDAINEEGR